MTTSEPLALDCVVHDVQDDAEDMLGELLTLPRITRGNTMSNKGFISTGSSHSNSSSSAEHSTSSPNALSSWIQRLNPFGSHSDNLVYPSDGSVRDDDGMDSNCVISSGKGLWRKDSTLSTCSESLSNQEAGIQLGASRPHSPITSANSEAPATGRSHHVADVFSLFRLGLVGPSVSQLQNNFEKDSQSVLSESINSSQKHEFSRSQDQSFRSESSGESTRQRIMSLEAGMMAAKNTVGEASLFDIWAFVVTVVIGGLYYGWNEGFCAGFGSYAMAQLLVALAFVILACSMAEIVSTVSFSGGAYGMARVVLGFHAGFTIAMFEYLEYVVYLSQSAQYIGESVAMLLHTSESMAAVFSLLFFVFCWIVVFAGDRWFWRVSGTLAVVSLLVLLAYCLGSLPHVDFAQNATFGANRDSFVAVENWFVGGLRGFIHVLPFTTWMFGGFESAALLNDMTAEPRKNMPNGIVAGTLTLLAMGLLMLFITASLPPGLPQLFHEDHMMDYGWHFMGLTSNSARWVTIPAQVASGFGFVLPATKLMQAMVTSKLFPSLFSTEDNPAQSKTLYLTVTLVLGMFITFWSMKQPSLALENIPILFAQVTYLSNLYAFYKLRTDFSSRENMFRSPFGLVGAAYAAFIFFLVAVSVIGFQDAVGPPFFVFLVFLSLTVYYFAYAKQYQRFSDDEQKSLLVLHVIRNNRKKKRVIKTTRR